MRLTASAAVVMSVALLSGCATTGFVEETAAQIQTQVGAQVSQLRRDLDDSEAIVQQTAARIDAVEQTAQNAFAIASSAEMAAGMAQRTADQLGNTLESANRRRLLTTNSVCSSTV